MTNRKKHLALLQLLVCFASLLHITPAPAAGRLWQAVAAVPAAGPAAQVPQRATFSFSVLPGEENPPAKGRQTVDGSRSQAAGGTLLTQVPQAASHWAASELAALAGRMDLGRLLPAPEYLDNPLTRGEWALALGQLWALFRNEVLENMVEAVTEAGGLPLSFSDVPPEAPYAVYLGDLGRLGLLTGTGRGRFSPDQFLTRLELMVVAGRLLRLGGENLGVEPGLAGGSALAAYKDKNLLPDWARAEVELAVAAGVIRGCPGEVLVPHVPATRAEALAVLARLLQRLPAKEAL